VTIRGSDEPRRSDVLRPNAESTLGAPPCPVDPVSPTDCVAAHVSAAQLIVLAAHSGQCRVKSYKTLDHRLVETGAQVAQLVEHVTENHGVGGSIPPLGTNEINRLAKT
jgi:hypothetical protein